jgi:hypothetical protein
VKSLRRTFALVPLLAALAALSSCGESKSESKTVTVPNVKGKETMAAYDLLHEAGLRVSISETLHYQLRIVAPPLPLPRGGPLRPVVHRQTLQAGRIVRRGSVAGIETDHLILVQNPFKCYRFPGMIPSFVGETLGSLSDHERCFSIDAKKLPPLDAADEPHLLDNYVVTRQSPAPATPILLLTASISPDWTVVTVAVSRATSATVSRVLKGDLGMTVRKRHPGKADLFRGAAARTSRRLRRSSTPADRPD